MKFGVALGTFPAIFGVTLGIFPVMYQSSSSEFWGGCGNFYSDFGVISGIFFSDDLGKFR